MRRFKNNSRRTSKKVSITILFLVITMMGVGYAYINSTLNIGGTTKIIKNTWDVHFDNITTVNSTLTDDESITISTDKTNVTFNVNLETIEDAYQIDLDVVNDGGIDAMLNSISLTGLTDAQKEYLEFYATYNNGESLTINDLLPSKEFDVISVFIKYKDGLSLDNLSDTADYLTLNLTLGYGQAKKNVATNRGNNLISKIKTGATLDTSIDFNTPATTSGTAGVFILNSTQNDANPIYYYRGAVTNNNVRFANMCWKIVRTTSTGGIKLLYNGVPNTYGQCYGTGTSAGLTAAAYSLNSTDNTFMGYMFGKENATTYETTHSNLFNSNIKDNIDNWFLTKLNTSVKKLEDTIWCNDRVNAQSGKLIGNTSAYDRVSQNTPNLTCSTLNDSFTVSEKNGNGSLTYPVALMTADEAILAGASWNLADDASTLYINTGTRYALLGSSGLSDQSVLNVFTIEANGALYHANASESNAIRPMISLKRGAKFKSGTGTTASPYIVN